MAVGKILHNHDRKAAWMPRRLTAWLENSYALQTERYRYIRYGDGSEELCDHQNDLPEWSNLAQQPGFAPLRKRLSAELQGYLSNE